MTDIYVIYNNDDHIKEIGDIQLRISPFFHFIDDRTRTGRKDAWKVKNTFAAKLTPFVAIYDKDTPIKAFYSETERDVIKDLIDYLKENSL